jgi:hypothetical protein
MRRERHVALMRVMRNSYKILIGKLEAKRQLGKRRCSREANIKMDLRETTEFTWHRI